MLNTAKPTLLILAAGVGSRYGGLKQIDGFGGNNETIMEYSVFDAIRSGFGKVVFVIRKENHSKFKKIFNRKIEDKITIDYVFQSNNLSDYGLQSNSQRDKPWGTAHAILTAKDKITEPFCVINADDFYGLESFQKMARFLCNHVTDKHFSMVGYPIYKTLSLNGEVSRGICRVGPDSILKHIQEITRLTQTDAGIVAKHDDRNEIIAPYTTVSMNFWGFSPALFPILESFFISFLKKNIHSAKSEFYIADVVDYIIRSHQSSIEVISTNAQWFGVTYIKDKILVRDEITRLISRDIYPPKLWE